MTKLKCDGIIFDVDGTLWDSTEACARAYSKAATQEFGREYRIEADVLKTLFGKPLSEIADTLYKGEDPVLIRRVLEKTLLLESEALDEFPPAPYPGVTGIFRDMSRLVPLFIVSNCQAGYIEQFLRLNRAEDYITDHLCYDDTGLSKAKNIQLIVQTHQLKHPVYVGDTALDEQSCREAGVPFVFASYGFGTAAAPDAVIRSMSGLPSVLEIITQE